MKCATRRADQEGLVLEDHSGGYRIEPFRPISRGLFNDVGMEPRHGVGGRILERDPRHIETNAAGPIIGPMRDPDSANRDLGLLVGIDLRRFKVLG